MTQNSCPTVQIQLEPTVDNPTGIVVINESDFDEATMTKVDAVQKQEEAPVAPVAEVVPPAKTGKSIAPWATKA